jgi:peptidoglycan/LPS O-acetylase OafA/YrhL
MYAWVGVLGLLGVVRRRWLFNTVLLGLFIFGAIRPTDLPLVTIDAFVRLAALFALGGFCYINRAWIPIHGGLLLTAVAVAYLARKTSLYTPLFWLCEVLFVFWFAYNAPIKGFNRFGDYSYGIYLWGYPMQQIIAALFPLLPSFSNALLGFIGALAAGIASWHLVEKPALRLKWLSGSLNTFVRGRIQAAWNKLRAQLPFAYRRVDTPPNDDSANLQPERPEERS